MTEAEKERAADAVERIMRRYPKAMAKLAEIERNLKDTGDA